jgi:drug/metabolite transporter (DMT)-like permease
MRSSKTLKIKTYVLVFLLVLLGSVGNTILSKGMKEVGELDLSHIASIEAGALRIFSSGTVWLGVVCMLLFFICHMLVLSWADYSFVMPFSALAYALVPLLAYLFLGEHVAPTRWVGIALIFIGVVLINRTPLRTTEPR